MNQVKSRLFALNKDKSFQTWAVYVDGGSIFVEFGKFGGKIQTKQTICKPMNVGRSNETTAEEQAVLEAESKWEKQYRLGYRETMTEVSESPVLSPMLAHDALKRKSAIVYPATVQPKLDGLRCLITFDEEGEPVFNSRGNKTYPIQGKIVEQIKRLRASTGFDIFDGEVYLHGLSLQKIVSLAKKWRSKETIAEEVNKEYLTELKKWNKDPLSYEEPEPNVDKYGGYCSEDLEFHIFDVPTGGKVWYNPAPTDDPNDRMSDLSIASADAEFLSHLKFVPNKIVQSEADVLFDVAVNMQHGYEGTIIRNFKGVYEFGQRSSDLQKWKVFQTEEAYVDDAKEDNNGEGVLLCRMKSGARFKCKMKGTSQERSIANMLKLKGKFITFSFQALTDDGIPQFPVGLCVRDVDLIGWRVLE